MKLRKILVQKEWKKMKILKKTLYVCELCKRMYESAEGAEKCEESHGGIPIPPSGSTREIYDKDGEFKALILFAEGELLDEGL